MHRVPGIIQESQFFGIIRVLVFMMNSTSLKCAADIIVLVFIFKASNVPASWY